MENLTTRVNSALDQIRPFLNEDGGDVQLIEITKDYTAKVEFIGACKTCSMNKMTFAAGVEDAIMRNVPEIKKVEAVS